MLFIVGVELVITLFFSFLLLEGGIVGFFVFFGSLFRFFVVGFGVSELFLIEFGGLAVEWLMGIGVGFSVLMKGVRFGRVGGNGRSTEVVRVGRIGLVFS